MDLVGLGRGVVRGAPWGSVWQPYGNAENWFVIQMPDEKTDPKPVPEVMTVPEVAAFLRIDRNTAYLAVRQGWIPSVRLGRTIRISRAAVLEWLTKGQTLTRKR